MTKKKTDKAYFRSAMTQAALEFAPPLIRNSLLQDKDFRNLYGIGADAIISLGDDVVSFSRSSLFESIRRVLTSDNAEETIADTEGAEWIVRDIRTDESALPILAVSNGEQELILPNCTVLSSDRALRLRALEEAAADVNLPESARDAWRRSLTRRAIEDDEVDGFHQDFRDTPVHVARSIGSQARKGQGSIPVLAPSTARYYERLIGTYDGSGTVQQYAEESCRQFFASRMALPAYQRFLEELLLSSHSAICAEISIADLSDVELDRAYTFLIEHGDRISQLGAIEVGIRELIDHPELELPVIKLIENLRDDDVSSEESGFGLLSAFFILVDGEVSRVGILSKTRPYYRRLASLSQSAMICRELADSGVPVSTILQWALGARGEQFYMQALADMRLEPRWNPDLAPASQMKADFLGRIMIAAKNHEEQIKGSSLEKLIFGEEDKSIHSSIEFPFPYFPGPLEGGEETTNRLPNEWTEMINAQLADSDVSPDSFVALVNSALIFKVASNQAELAATMLKSANHRLGRVSERSQLVTVLNGLATVAAASRSRALANELRILVRRYRRDLEFRLSIDEAVRICLVSAASIPELHEWAVFVGEWLTELSFGDLEGDEGRILSENLGALCDVVPELWISSSRGEAALRAHMGC